MGDGGLGCVERFLVGSGFRGVELFSTGVGGFRLCHLFVSIRPGYRFWVEMSRTILPRVDEERKDRV